MGNVVYLNHAKPVAEEGDRMDVEQFRTDILRPPLKMVGGGFWSMQAESLLLGTAAMESHLKYVRQFKNGPALSLMQIEPATYLDTCRYLNQRQPAIRDRILAACYLDTFPPPDALIWNMRLAALIARSIYWMVPEPLPESNDLVGMAEYYIQFYHRGTESTVQEFVDAWAYVHSKDR